MVSDTHGADMTGGWATTRRQRVAGLSCAAQPAHDEEEDRSAPLRGYNMQQRLHNPPLLCLLRWHLIKRFADLPVGALLSHCIFPVRNDVGSALRDDVVVILSIWGKGLGGTGHLGLANVEQIVCPLSGRGKEKEKRRNDAKKVPHLRGFFPLSAYSSQISAAMTSLWPGSCDHRGWLMLLLADFSSPKDANQSANKQTIERKAIIARWIWLLFCRRCETDEINHVLGDKSSKLVLIKEKRSQTCFSFKLINAAFLAVVQEMCLERRHV